MALNNTSPPSGFVENSTGSYVRAGAEPSSVFASCQELLLNCRYALLCFNFHIGRTNSVNRHVERLDGNKTLRKPA